MNSTLLPGASAAKTQLPTLLDVSVVAAMLDCSQRHIYRLSDAGQMPPPLKVGKLVRWRRSDIETWIADSCRAVRLSREAVR
jgi:excisionase family DNA binding protein